LQKCKALLDSVSQSNFITEDLVLRLPRYKNPVPIQGINNVMSEMKDSINIELQSIASTFQTNLTCLVLPCITNNLPSEKIQYQHWNLPKDIQLADSTVFQPSKTDLLLGADAFFKILLPKQL
jgi:hypothetical protein